MSNNDLSLNFEIKNALKKAKIQRSWNPLFEIEKLPEVIKNIPAHDLYLIIKRTGLTDSIEILEMVTPEQIQTFIDFDCWNKDNLLLVNLLDWIQVLINLEPEKFGKIFEQLDMDVTALFFYESVYIFNLKEKEAPDWGNYPYYSTPDTFFELRPKSTTDEDIWRGVTTTLERLYMYDISFAQKILIDAMWNTKTSLQEGAYKWMTGRLADQGFSDYLSALEVYRFIDPNSVKINEKTREYIPENPTLLPIKNDTYVKGNFKETLNKLDSKTIEHIEINLIFLINKMASADRIDFDDEKGLTKIAHLASASLNLGMFFIAKNDENKYATVLKNIVVSRIFRVGYSLILQLKGLAQTLSRSGHISLTPRTHTFLEGAWLSFYLSLTSGHPMFNTEFLGKKGEKYFEKPEEVAFAGLIIEEMSSIKGLIFNVLKLNPTLLTNKGLKNTSRKTASTVTFGDLLRSAFISFVLYQNFSKVPLPFSDLNNFNEKLKNINVEYTIKQIIKYTKETLKQDNTNINIQRIFSTHIKPLFEENSDFLSLLIVTEL